MSAKPIPIFQHDGERKPMQTAETPMSLARAITPKAERLGRDQKAMSARYASVEPPATAPKPKPDTFGEKHFLVKELADMISCHPVTVRRKAEGFYEENRWGVKWLGTTKKRRRISETAARLIFPDGECWSPKQKC
jgi:hypothetical protein